MKRSFYMFGRIMGSNERWDYGGMGKSCMEVGWRRVWSDSGE